MTRLSTLLNKHLSKSLKLKILISTIALSWLILISLDLIFPEGDIFGLLYTILLIGNFIIWIYLYFLHNMKVDIKQLKEEQNRNKF